MVDDSVLDRQCIDPNDSSGWLNSSFPCPPQTRHGYFETSPNVDAVALRVTSPDLAEELYASVQAVKGLRPCAWTISMGEVQRYPSTIGNLLILGSG